MNLTEDTFKLSEHPHKRYNILTGEWVLVAPHRTKRPWQGKVEAEAANNRPEYDPACYLCPGNKRSDGSQNPAYIKSYSFINDFSSLLEDTPVGKTDIGGLLKAESQSGICKVISFSPRHDLTLPELSLTELAGVIDMWVTEYRELSQHSFIKYIQIFENKGDIMGCSNPHPHGQIWAQSSVPVEVEKETLKQKEHYLKNGSGLLADYLKIELEQQERVVFENEDFVALVPFWAIWPYETMLISKRHVKDVTEFTDQEKVSLAEALKKLTTLYDNLFKTSFPYSAGMHQAPVNDGEHPEWHWHMHFYPPLLRSATVKKFMVGYELLANAQRDITPEFAAAQLRQQSDIHYKTRA
jgi:UDPglucose--hexose-1-phosphate uridylyltransferase